MISNGDSLFDLLPALYRIKDAQLAQSQNLLSPADAAQLQALQTSQIELSASDLAQLEALTAKASRGPLQSLLMLIEEQVEAVAYDLDQLYNDQFIETCSPWVIPYLGDLIGYQAVYGKAPSISTPRAEVANTISFRRRKGTLLVLEQLARDVTGWAAHAVEFFKLLATSQSMNHVRPTNYYCPDLRSWRPRACMDSAFDTTAHKVDVRRIAVERGRYNIQNIGIFLWSLNSYSLTVTPALPAPTTNGSPCFRFSSLGRDIPLFNQSVSQGPDITAGALPINVPDRLLRRVLCQDVQTGAGALYYRQGASLALYLNNQFLNPSQVQVCNLSGPDAAWINVPPVGSRYAAAIDPELGRIALPASAAGSPPAMLAASFHYGFNADMGGGEYPRSASFTDLPNLTTVRIFGAGANIQAAINSISTTGGVVEITDSGIYPNPGVTSAAPLILNVNLSPGVTVELRAADGCRPTLILGAEMTVTGGSESTFSLNGLLMTENFTAKLVPTASAPAALINVPATSATGANALSQLKLNHCTLVPGLTLTPQGAAQPSTVALPVLVAAPAGLTIEASTCILGGLRTEEGVTVAIADSILDAANHSNVAYSASDGITGGGALTLTGCTVIGKVHATLLALVSDCIFRTALATPDTWPFPLWSDRKQQGCMRFSFLPAVAATPKAFECLSEADGAPAPLFQSLRYGDPAYCKLFPSTDDAVRRGAEDGGEMGAFHFVFAPLRETDLRVRLQEYIPVGLEFGLFYET